MKVTNWGNWNEFDACPNNEAAKSIKFNIQSNQGSGDDTSINAVEIRCTNGYRANTINGTSTPVYGTWNTESTCSAKSYLIGIQVGAQASQGSSIDDYAITNLNALCSDGKWFFANGPNNGFKFGPEKYCREGTYIIAIRGQTENVPGAKDNTGLNNIIFKCGTISRFSESSIYKIIFKYFILYFAV